MRHPLIPFLIALLSLTIPATAAALTKNDIRERSLKRLDRAGEAIRAQGRQEQTGTPFGRPPQTGDEESPAPGAPADATAAQAGPPSAAGRGGHRSRIGHGRFSSENGSVPAVTPGGPALSLPDHGRKKPRLPGVFFPTRAATRSGQSVRPTPGGQAAGPGPVPAGPDGGRCERPPQGPGTPGFGDNPGPHRPGFLQQPGQRPKRPGKPEKGPG